MEFTTLYKSKLTTPADAVGRIASGVTLSMGMAMSEPPALLKALADRAAADQVDDLKIYYYESTRIAGETILRYELADRMAFLHPETRVLFLSNLSDRTCAGDQAPEQGAAFLQKPFAPDALLQKVFELLSADS